MTSFAWGDGMWAEVADMRGLLVVASVSLAVGLIVSVPRFWTGDVGATWGTASEQRGADATEIEVTPKAIIQPPEGPCAVLLAPASGEPLLPVFIHPFEAEALVEALHQSDAEADQSPTFTADGVLLALIDALGGRLEKVRIETPQPLNSRGSLHVRMPSGTRVLTAPGAIVLAIALFSSTPLTIDRAGLKAWGMARQEIESLIESLSRTEDGRTAAEQTPGAIGL